MEYFQDNPASSCIFLPNQNLNRNKNSIVKPNPVSFIPVEIFEKSLQEQGSNNFVKFLMCLLDAETVRQLIHRYFIGSSQHWPGSIVFWQMDQKGKLRTGKIMLYNPETGKRIKDPFPHITWVHKTVNNEDFNLQQCFFGEHLLKLDSTSPVGLVESEKTALIATAYLPQFIWLAAGSLTNLNTEKCKPLQGRNVYLFPDLNGYEKWGQKATELNRQMPGSRFVVSDLLERKASPSEKEQGLDLADYLIRFDWNNFRKKPALSEPITDHVTIPNSKSAKIINEICPSTDNFSQPEITPLGKALPSQQNEPSPGWEIADLEKFFNSALLPSGSFKLNQSTTITNIHLFIDSHLEIIRTNNGNKTYKPYFNRLIQLRGYLKGEILHSN